MKELKVRVRVFKKVDSRSGVSERTGKEWSFHNQLCELVTDENMPSVPFDLDIADPINGEPRPLEPGVYEFDLLPEQGKFKSIKWNLENPVKVTK